MFVVAQYSSLIIILLVTNYSSLIIILLVTVHNRHQPYKSLFHLHTYTTQREGEKRSVFRFREGSYHGKLEFVASFRKPSLLPLRSPLLYALPPSPLASPPFYLQLFAQLPPSNLAGHENQGSSLISSISMASSSLLLRHELRFFSPDSAPAPPSLGTVSLSAQSRKKMQHQLSWRRTSNGLETELLLLQASEVALPAMAP